MGATPASLLDLIARGGSMQVGIDQNKERALTEAALANAVQSKAAAKELEAQTAKHNAELEAFNQAQADNQVISDAFAHVGGNRSMMDKYIKANASGAGVMRWQMENEKLREQASKASAADLDRAEKVHKVMGSSLGYLNDVPDEQLQAEYAKVAPQIQQLDPSIKLPPQIDRMGLKRIMGQLTFADEILKGQKEQAEIEGRRQQTEAATKDAALKERGAFLQAIRPDMPSEEYAAVRAAFPAAAKSFPAAPGQWMKAAAQEAVKVGDRPKVAAEQQKLDNMVNGVDAEKRFDVEHQDMRANRQNELELKRIAEQVRHNRMTEDETGKLTPEAKLKMAEMFATTGALPPLGMGKAASGMRSEIINLAAQRFPNVDFATQKAAFQANNDSLKAYQKQKDNIEGFEATAGKNLDNFLKTASKVVDSGSPFLNTPLRAINEKMLGSTDQAAFNVARQVAVTEIAKVLNNPGGNAALSDSARHEVQELIGPNATLKQVFTAAKILRQDMASRKQAMDEQIHAIKSRIQTPNAPNATPGAKGDPLGVR